MMRGDDALAAKTQAKLEADHRTKLSEIGKMERQLAALTSAKPASEQIAIVRGIAGTLDGLQGEARVWHAERLPPPWGL